MSYDYPTERKWVFTDDGGRQLLRISWKADELLKVAGAATMGKLIAGEAGGSWEMMACVDRLVEVGELKEVNYGPCPGQYRIFVRPY